MLKLALFFALAALVVALSAPSLLPNGSRPVVSAAVSRDVAPPPDAPPADAAAKNAVPDNGDSGFREASIPADARGQYHAEAVINGRPVEMLVDTGATVVALSAETAARLGVSIDPGAAKWRMSTANGVSFASPVLLSRVSVGGIDMTDVQAVVMPRGATQANLLGASFLKRLASVEQRDGVLWLRQ